MERALHVLFSDSKLTPHLRWSVDQKLPMGVCHWLRGPNGSGKTSFITELKIRWPDLAPELALGFTDQESFRPYQDLTVAQAFSLLGEVVPERREATDWRAFSWWTEVDRNLWGRKVAHLSGGENQWLKILLMRSLRSDAWLLDEPFAGLDTVRRSRLEAMVVDWLAEGRFLLMTHHGENLPWAHQRWRLDSTGRGLALSEDGA